MSKNKKLTQSQLKQLSRYQLKMRNKLIKRQHKRLKKVFNQLKDNVVENEQLFLKEIAFSTFSTQLIYNYKVGIKETIDETIKLLTKHRGMSKELIPTVRNKALEEFSSKVVAKKVSKVSESVKEKIKTIVATGQSEGKNVKQIAKEIKDNLEDMSNNRAMIIARTETSTTSSTTYLEGLIKAGLPKTWIYTHRSKKSRESHLACNNETQEDASKPFSNGLMCPHHKDADISEVINCHCRFF